MFADLLPRRLSIRSVVFHLVVVHLLIAVWLLTPLVAHAQGVASDQVADPTGMLTAVLSTIAVAFPGVARYLPTVMALLSAVVGLCLLITAMVPPPTTASPRWLIKLYRLVSLIAVNFGHARNATVPGMPPEVRDAAIIQAKLTAAAPEQAVVAGLATIAKPVVMSGERA